jgi:hypothetical protein
MTDISWVRKARKHTEAQSNFNTSTAIIDIAAARMYNEQRLVVYHSIADLVAHQSICLNYHSTVTLTTGESGCPAPPHHAADLTCLGCRIVTQRHCWTLCSKQ